MHHHTNALIHESSPYLLQHAHNPVNWYPWGEEAFALARKENKPVLVSIGYAACHWCHVMERESFESEEVAAIMNEHFVNIKVDREERPDVDHMYMDAVQAISGSGGWPLNVFVTPDRKPFYGGTYFPPQRAFNRASWTEVLLSISQAFREKREEVEAQASQLTEHLRVANAFGIQPAADAQGLFEEARLHEACQAILQQADDEWGGFGRAPKFPQTFTIGFLLDYAHRYHREEARQQALLSLDKMAQGGIYDHIGGGFARYSTDTEWLVPHFEKMLYDNALLVMNYVQAWQITGDERYRAVFEETLAFVERELMHPEGGFYSALDADSEGVEGKFYVWSREEVEAVLGEEAAQFCAFYDISSKGNWEHSNIPWIQQPLKEWASARGLDAGELDQQFRRNREQLLAVRAGRVRPQLDDKVLLGWNALMNQAFMQAYAATGNRHYREKAEANLRFLMQAFKGNDGGWHHTWKDGKAKYPAFLDDYAYLIAAQLLMGQYTGELHWLEQARDLTDRVFSEFADPDSPFFFYTSAGQEDVLVRKKEVYDGATPSGNAVMAGNIYQLSIIFDRAGWRAHAQSLVEALGAVIIKYPTSFGRWLDALKEMITGVREIAVLGAESKIYLEKILGIYISHKLVLSSEVTKPEIPLLAHKAGDSKILIYLCKNYACRYPVSTIQEFVSLL